MKGFKIGSLRFGVILSLILLANQSFATSSGDLSSDIKNFLLAIAIIIVILGVGVFLFYLFRYSDISNYFFKDVPKEKASSTSQKFEILQKLDEERHRKKIMGIMDDEEYRHSQKIHSLVRNISDFNVRRRFMDEESRHQKEVLLIFQNKEGIEQLEPKMQGFQTKRYVTKPGSYVEGGDTNFLGVKAQLSQTKQQITEQGLIEWWNEFGNQTFSKCRESLKERFFNVEIIRIKGKKDPDDWRIIGIKNTSGFCYILPRKYSGWWTDFMKKESDYEDFFEPEEKSPDATLWIKSLKLPFTKGQFVNGHWKISTKCKVGFREA